MSRLLYALNEERTVPYKKREPILALAPDKVYDDGRTKQCHKDECDINKIMARFEVTGTMSHLSKYEASYADYSNFDYHEQLQKLTRGREIFDDLPAEIRREFQQNPAAFFEYVNDPANTDELREKLKGLASPGRQMPLADLPPIPDPPDPVPEPDPEPDPI